MPRPAISLAAAALCAALLALPAAAVSPPEIVSDTAVLMDAATGQVLYDGDMHRRMYPASVTKIMTAVLVLENCSTDEILTVSQSAVEIDEWNSATIGLVPGERLTVDDVLYGMMLPSANEAANALAEHVAGSQEAFARMMTEKAAELGALDTQFQNAHGLHEDGHYTTAYDMALITRYAAQNRDFLRYFGEAAHTIPPTNLQPVQRSIKNYQRMLTRDSEFYDPSVLGGKVGFTSEAAHTMSTVAEKYGRRLVCVVMHSDNRDDKFADTRALLSYGFLSFRPVTLSAATFGRVTVPVDTGDTAGTAELYATEDFSALLRNDLSGDGIYIEHASPQVYNSTAEISPYTYVRIDTDDPTLPQLLGAHPLQADITLAPVPAGDSARTPGGVRALIAVICACAGAVAVLVCLLVLLWRRSREQKRRRARMARINRRIRREYSGARW